MDMYLDIKIADECYSKYRVITNYKGVYDLASLIPEKINEVELKEGSVISFLYHNWKIVLADYGNPCGRYIIKIVK